MTRAAVQDRIALLRDLRAVRRFGPEPVPEEVVNDLLEVARWTGSGSNSQPWELILVRNRQTLEMLAGVDGPPGPRHLAGAALAVVVVFAGESAAFDEGRLAERIMLAAAAHGLGSSIGMLGPGQVTAAKTILDIPTDRALRTAVSIGYPADNRARLVSAEQNRPDPDIRQPLTTLPVGRKPLTDIVHYERYGQRPPAQQELG